MSNESLCAICQCPLSAHEPQHICPACATTYHEECWRENKGCAVYGCVEVPATEHRDTLEIPAAWWGRENKPCPNCGGEILAAAVRCRHCGAMFQNARPEEREEFRARHEIELRLPAARKTAVGIFIACLLPFIGFVGTIFGCVWMLRHRSELRALPAIYGVLCRLGVVVGLVQTVGTIAAAMIYSTLHS